MRGTYLCTVLFGFCLLLQESYAATCSEIDAEEECERGNSCYWMTSISKCGCNSTTDWDVVFALDSSGSVGSDYYVEEKNFVVDMIETGLSLGSNVGLVVYSASSGIYWDFDDPQRPRDEVLAEAASLSYLGGATATRLGLNDCLEIFADTGKGLPRLIMFLTDGNPNPFSKYNPCTTSGQYRSLAQATRDNLEDSNATVIIIGVGDEWNPSVLHCIVNDPDTDIIYADDFSEASLDAIRFQTDAFLCPQTRSLVLSEVRVENGSRAGDRRFLEVYNTGDFWDFSGDKIIISGFLNCEYAENSLDSGRYLVFYDGSVDFDDHWCYNCTCGGGTLVDKECSNAQYIDISTLSTSCSFDDTQNNTMWNVHIRDDQSTVTTYVDVVYDNGFTTGGTIDMERGYTFELQSIDGSQTSANNWARSCHSYGTPGDGPVSPCIVPCKNNQCRAGGDTGATCGLGGGCDCTQTYTELGYTGFYYYQGTCKKVPPPDNCVVTITKDYDDDTQEYIQFELMLWDEAPISLDVYYRVDYTENGEDKTSLTGLNDLFFTYSDQNALVSPLPWVRTVLQLNGTNYLSSWHKNCTLMTTAPSVHPTPSPTWQLPTVTCNARVVAGSNDQFTVEWSNVEKNFPTNPNSTGYYVYFYFNGSLWETEFVDWQYNDDDYTFTHQLQGAPITDVLSQIEIKVVQEIVDRWGNIYKDMMIANAATCPLVTIAPTTQPTDLPSDNPSPAPTTTAPTMNPTVTPPVIAECWIKLQVGSTSTFSANYTLTPPTSGAVVTLQRNGADHDTFSSNPDTFTSSNAASHSWCAYVTWEKYVGGPDMTSSCTACPVRTVSPTLSPSDSPSPQPTDMPSHDPTPSPTNDPTTHPTPAPTYEPLQIDNCTVLLGYPQSSSIVPFFDMIFYEPEFDENGVTTPFYTDVRYYVNWNDDDILLSAINNGRYPQEGTGWQRIDDDIHIQRTVKVTVVLGDETNPLGDEVPCEMRTRAPTTSPTASPGGNPCPVGTNPKIGFKKAGNCEGGEGADQSGKVSYPVCSVQESSEPVVFTVEKDPSNFVPDITFQWEIRFCDPDSDRNDQAPLILGDDEQRAEKKDFSTTKGSAVMTSASSTKSISFLVTEDRRRLIQEAHREWKSRQLLQGSNDPSFRCSQPNADEDEGDSGDKDTEYAYLTLVSCTAADDSCENSYSCSTVHRSGGPYTTLILQIEDTSSGGTLNKENVGALPYWLWIIIGAGILLLGVVALFGWRFYQGKKYAEVMAMERDKELQNTDIDEGADDFGGTGDTVAFNPLANMGTADIGTGGQYMDNRLDQQKANFEVAQVDVDAEVFRQDFGPVQQDKR